MPVQGPGGAEGANPGMSRELAELPGSKHRWREVGSWERLDASKGSGGVASVSGEARQHGVQKGEGGFLVCQKGQVKGQRMDTQVRVVLMEEWVWKPSLVGSQGVCCRGTEICGS